MMTARVITTAKHDDRKGHHYYTTPSTSASCIVVMTLAVIMPAISLTLQKHERHPSLGNILRIYSLLLEYKNTQGFVNIPDHNRVYNHVPHWSAVHGYTPCYRS